MNKNRSVVRAITILECLFEDDFKGKTLGEISADTNIPSTTAWRILKTIEAKGWVIDVPIAGSKQGAWRLSTKIVGIADSYEQHALAQVQGIKREFQQVTGRELRA